MSSTTNTNRDGETVSTLETPENYLKRIYASSAKINPQFSMRGFAKKLGLSSGGLSHILTGKRKLSVDRAYEIATALKLDEKEKDYFMLLVQMQSSKTHARKAELYDQIQKDHTDKVGVQDLSVENFRLISDWHGLAILQYISVISGNHSASVIAKKLSISKTDVELTLDRLTKLELIEKTKTGYAPSSDRLMVNSNLPNEAIQNYYQSVNECSTKSIKTQSPKEKVIGTEVFAFDPANLEEVRSLTDRYLDDLNKIAKKGKNRTEIYQAFTNVFKLTDSKEKP